MAQRRSLIAGVNAPENTDPEAVRVFVAQEPPKPTQPDERPELAVVHESNSVAEELDAQPPAATEPKSPPRKKEKGRLPVGLIPVTVRLRPAVAGALKRASLERQLAGEDLHTQQDIVEQALEPWLRSEGYL